MNQNSSKKKIEERNYPFSLGPPPPRLTLALFLSHCRPARASLAPRPDVTRPRKKRHTENLGHPPLSLYTIYRFGRARSQTGRNYSRCVVIWRALLQRPGRGHGNGSHSFLRRYRGWQRAGEEGEGKVRTKEVRPNLLPPRVQETRPSRPAGPRKDRRSDIIV